MLMITHQCLPFLCMQVEARASISSQDGSAAAAVASLPDNVGVEHRRRRRSSLSRRNSSTSSYWASLPSVLSSSGQVKEL